MIDNRIERDSRVRMREILKDRKISGRERILIIYIERNSKEGERSSHTQRERSQREKAPREIARETERL